MAEAKSQAEPTMEEILASIRRIISEDEPGAAAPEPEQPRAEPEAEPAAAAAEEPAAPAEEATAPAEDNVLDLTQKLNEDGTVVDLADRTVGAEGAEPSEPEPEPEPEPEMMAEPEAEPETMAEAEPEPEPEPFEEVPAEEPAEEPESLLAPAVQAATMGSLAEITKAVASGRRASVHVGDGRSLEDIVREALTPELKAWLDANLAPLVEQIVRDEVKKMVRRAEEL